MRQPQGSSHHKRETRPERPTTALTERVSTISDTGSVEKSTDNSNGRESPYSGTITWADVSRRGEEKARAKLSASERFETTLWAERNAWSIRQRQRGRIGERRLRRCDAERALSMALAAMEGGAE